MQDANDSAAIQLATEALGAAATKLDLAIQLLRNEDNDVSQETLSFIQQYLDRIRHSKGTMSR